MNTQETKNMIEEDEIDLKELFNTLVKYKIFIILFTLFVTFVATFYVYNKTPIYEVKSNVQVGFIGNTLVDSSDVIVKKLNIIFNVEEKPDIKEQFNSEVSSITTNKKLKNFIEIKTQAISNDDALKKNKEVVSYLQNIYEPKIHQYIFNTKNQIKATQQAIDNINNFERKNLQRQIDLLKTQKITAIDEKINTLKSQDIKKIQRHIKLLKTQDIPKINEKIQFFTQVKIPALITKIKFHTDKLKEYTVAVNDLYKNNKSSENTIAQTISSIQMVNYQNLILNSQNKIEDLKIEIEKIRNEIIPNLKRQKENILNVSIKDLQLKIDNINNITIKNLERQKENIQNDTIRKLEYQLHIGLENKEAKLQEKIKQLNYNLCSQNVQNSYVVGHYIVYDYPVKPKKKLIIIVAFVTGLILSIFLVLLYTFIKKEDEI